MLTCRANMVSVFQWPDDSVSRERWQSCRDRLQAVTRGLQVTTDRDGRGEARVFLHGHGDGQTE